VVLTEVLAGGDEFALVLTALRVVKTQPGSVNLEEGVLHKVAGWHPPIIAPTVKNVAQLSTGYAVCAVCGYIPATLCIWERDDWAKDALRGASGVSVETMGVRSASE
jgi:hypothetical protein